MEHETYNLIARYHAGKLTEAERAGFEERLRTDAAFTEEVAIWAAVYQGIQEEGDRMLDAKLGDLGRALWLKEDTESPLQAVTAPKMTAKRFQMPRWIYAAAAVLLLLLLAWPVWQSLNPSDPIYASNDALFAKHLSLPPAPQVRDEKTIPWQEAYRRGQYPEAIAALEQLAADSTTARRSETYLYLGLSYLAAGQAKAALDALQKIGPESFDWEDAQWYQALAYLKGNDSAEAKAILQNIAGKPGPRQGEAREILAKMR